MVSQFNAKFERLQTSIYTVAMGVIADMRALGQN